MDNQTAKEILSAYRPNGEDARDENFREALEQCRHDPEMREWLAEEHRFDARIRDALSAIQVPREGKERLLQGPSFAEDEPPSSGSGSPGKLIPFPWLRVGTGIAALFLVGLILWQAFPRLSQPSWETEGFTVAGLISEAMPLSYRNDNPEAILAWLEERQAPVQRELPIGLSSAEALGCRVFKIPQGGQVSLLCLLKNGEVVHYFIFDEEARVLLADAPINTWWEESGWHIYSFEQDGQRIAIATQGDTGFI